MAASATFALKAGLWFRRGRLVMVSSCFRHLSQNQARIPLTPAVRFFRASSDQLTPDELAVISAKSNDVVAGLGVPYKCITSYVAGDEIYCVHEALGADGSRQIEYRKLQRRSDLQLHPALPTDAECQHPTGNLWAQRSADQHNEHSGAESSVPDKKTGGQLCPE
jgi:hypothetical protein